MIRTMMYKANNPSGTQLPAGLFANLVAWYKCDETTGDRLNSVVGGANNMVGNTHGSTSGILGNAMLLSTSVEAPRVPYNSAIDFSNKDFSISMWFRQPSTGFNSILRKLGAGGGQDFSFYSNNSGRFQVSSYTTSPNIPDLTTSVPTGLTSGGLHHIVVTFNNTSKIFSFYTDNVARGTIATGGGSVGNIASGSLWLGTYSAGGNAEQAYRYDEIGIWANRVLTAGEVTSLWNSGLGVTY